MNKKITTEIAIGIILILAIAVGGYFWLQGRPKLNPTFNPEFSPIQFSMVNKQESAKFSSKDECETQVNDQCFYLDCNNPSISTTDTLFPLICEKPYNPDKFWVSQKQASGICLKWCSKKYGEPSQQDSTPNPYAGISAGADCEIGCGIPQEAFSENDLLCITEPGKSYYPPKEKCCNGLKSIFGSDLPANECRIMKEQGGGAPACAPCGNGKCEKNYGENNCSCPEDCRQ